MQMEALSGHVLKCNKKKTREEEHSMSPYCSFGAIQVTRQFTTSPNGDFNTMFLVKTTTVAS